MGFMILMKVTQMIMPNSQKPYPPGLISEVQLLGCCTVQRKGNYLRGRSPKELAERTWRVRGRPPKELAERTWRVRGRPPKELAERVRGRPPKELAERVRGRPPKELAERVRGRPPKELVERVRGRPPKELAERVRGRPPKELAERVRGRPPKELAERVRGRPPKELAERVRGRPPKELAERVRGRPLKELAERTWRVRLLCLDGPHRTTCPSRSNVEQLRSIRLGSPWWMPKEVPAVIPLTMSARCFKYVLSSFSPKLQQFDYDLCISGGRNNHTLTPLYLPGTVKIGWKPLILRDGVGKGQLYIQPKQKLDTKPTTDMEVSTHISCLMFYICEWLK